MRPEKLLIDALWQRIDGRSMEKFEINLDMDEYNLACSRAKIQELIESLKQSRKPCCAAVFRSRSALTSQYFKLLVTI